MRIADFAGDFILKLLFGISTLNGCTRHGEI